MRESYDRQAFIKWLSERIQKEVDDKVFQTCIEDPARLKSQDSTFNNFRSTGVTRSSSINNSRSLSRPATKKFESSLRSEQVRQILTESFQLFRNIHLTGPKLDELEEQVFSCSFLVSPRTAARAILELMDT